MSSSSSEEEMDEAFRESADCDYITQMVGAPSKSETQKPTGQDRHQPDIHINAGSLASNRVPFDDDGTDHFKETGFEKFLANRLACRLDENIKIVEKKKLSLPSNTKPSECGIRLFSSSPKVAELIDIIYEQSVPPRKRSIAQDKSIDYNGRAEEAAVSHQWVKDPSNTAFWKDNKKPRVMSAKHLKNLSNGGLECLPLSNGF